MCAVQLVEIYFHINLLHLFFVCKYNLVHHELKSPQETENMNQSFACLMLISLKKYFFFSSGCCLTLCLRLLCVLSALYRASRELQGYQESMGNPDHRLDLF